MVIVSKSGPKVIVEGVAYYPPPEPKTIGEDFYRHRSQQILAKYGRLQLEGWVNARVSSEANWLINNRYSRREKPLSSKDLRITSQRYVQRWPWSFRTWTTSKIFVPTHYERSRLPEVARGESVYALGGLSMRITESKDLVWRPAQVATPLDFVYELQAANTATSWKHHEAVRPLKSKFERTTVEQLPDEILAALWYRLHKTPLY